MNFTKNKNNMARYIFVNKKIALEKGLIKEDTVRMISKDGTLVSLMEDDLKKMDGDSPESKASELGAELLTQKEAIKIINKEF